MKIISAGGIHFCDFWADLPSGHRKYRLKIQRNVKQTHVVVHMTMLRSTSIAATWGRLPRRPQSDRH